MNTHFNSLMLASILFFSVFSCTDKSKTEGIMRIITENTIAEVNKELLLQYGEAERFRIEKGTSQVALFWQKEDGDEEDFKQFCIEHFATGKELDALFDKLERNFEILYGYFTKMTVELMMPIHLEDGKPVSKIDLMFGSYSPSAHLEEDFFNNKIAFIILLNFPYYNLEQKNTDGINWTAQQWAFARIGDLHTSRVPADLLMERSRILTEADNYISRYNIHVSKLRDDKEEQYFADDLILISHWGLRDELKSQYANENGLNKQRIIYQVMKRIINQEIPVEVINKNDYLWYPYKNKLMKNGKNVTFSPEPNTRYEFIRKIFNILKEIDKYHPYHSTYLEQRYEKDLQISFEEIEKMFIDYISAPEIKRLGQLICNRLGRPLEPFDIWYDGFKSRSEISETELDKIVMTKYKSVTDFEDDIFNILTKFNFSKSEAEFIASHIKVERSRGAGHAQGSAMKNYPARLRTRATDKGMDYKSFNIAMHELGHNVEQTISLHNAEHYFIFGVPNTAFSEALAFMFQKRDMNILNQPATDINFEILDLAWSLYEIMGVSLVDMYLWKWLYQNPNASAEQIKKATIDIARDVWNKYYADIFQSKNQEILAIYSHIISYPLYLPAYPLGHIIEFQLEETIKNKTFGKEIFNIFSTGSLTPNVWMLKNTGNPISGKFLLSATERILNEIQ